MSYYITIGEDGEISIEHCPLNNKGEINHSAMLKEMQKFVGGYVERIQLRSMERAGINHISMYVNEEGKLIKNFNTNLLASRLYEVEKHGQNICGPVVIVWEPWNYLSGGPEIQGFNAEQLSYILRAIQIMKYAVYPADEIDLW